jgi:hypothetical protein
MVLLGDAPDCHDSRAVGYYPAAGFVGPVIRTLPA